MSAESRKLRKPTEPERRLLQALFSRCDECSPEWLPRLLVSAMKDGGMGSLKLYLLSGTEQHRRFGRRAAEVHFTDTDGVAVIASLNLDQEGLPLEMDIWKTDFSPLVQVPASLNSSP